MKLEGKTAVITGGAMGNGLGIVKVFLKHGAKVIILDYSKELCLPEFFRDIRYI